MSNRYFSEQNVRDLLQTAVFVFDEVGALRDTNEILTLQHNDDAYTVANLTETVANLQAALANTQAQLSDALARESQLRSDLANSEAIRISVERELIDANAANVSLSGDKDFWYREALTNETLRREAETKFTEADTKLARFRDILGIPSPVNPTPALESPTLDLLANPVASGNSPDAPIELPNPGFTPEEPSAPFPSSSGTYGWDS